VRLEFGLLGPLKVRCDGVVLPVSSPRQRVVLASLLLRSNQVVAVEQVAEALWGSALPRSARVAAQNYVKRLRDALGEPGRRIVTQAPGYLIRASPDEIDLALFEEHLKAAQAAATAGSWHTAAKKSHDCLLLWRGEPLADVPSDYLASLEVPRLVEMRLRAREIGIEAALHLGQHSAAISELHRLVASDPLRERLSGLLMAALQADGRQGEALAVYQQTRDRLVAELGAEPGTELRAVHQRILAGEPALPGQAGPPPIPAASGQASGALDPEVPRQLPAAVSCFTGRSRELAALTSTLNEASSALPTTVISAIGGTAGVGKTALAIHWAHQVAWRFPDGQLYVNLRSYDPGQPLAPGEALASFLATLGVPGPQIPAEEHSRAAAYRSALAGRRVLIVLDNAHDPEQVRPLLPGEPGCLVVITSRDTLAGLVARDGARRVTLDVLPLADAVALLRALIGPRVDTEPDAAIRLAGICCRLPLAMRVAAELAASRPELSLAALAAELGGQARLDALEAGGDQGTAVRTVFSWSHRYLSPSAARAFALAALHPGNDFDTAAVTALTGTSRPQAARALAELTRASLIGQGGSGRYEMHDLLRTYAAELATATYDDRRREQALTRLFDHYLYAARRAASILSPADTPPPADPAGRADGADIQDEPTARAWLDAERANLTAVAAYAADHDRAGHAIGLSAAMFRYLDAGGFYADALVIHGAAEQGAVRSGDRGAQAGAVINLAATYGFLGHQRKSEQYLRRALQLSREAGDRLGEIRSLLNLGVTYVLMGAYSDAIASCQHALKLSRDTGNRTREARALMLLGQIAIRQGHYKQAAADLDQAAEAIRATGDLTFLTLSLISLSDAEVRQGRIREAKLHLKEAREVARQSGQAMAGADAIALLGLADLREGRHQQAAKKLDRALATFHDAGVLTQEARVLCHLGELDLRMGRPVQATDHYQQALIIYQQIAEPSGEAEARNGLGEAALARREIPNSRGHHQAALAIARKITTPDQQARALEGLGNLTADDGDEAGARTHWQHALACYAEMDVPDADRVRAKLDAAAATQTQVLEPH
jgi:DNA-binding SARP family transcriptional activator/tetratricopeptide (TPR) repeat protein